MGANRSRRGTEARRSLTAAASSRVHDTRDDPVSTIVERSGGAMLVEVTVARLGLDSSTNSYVVILREKAGRRLLPIWIGQPEAESIIMQMNEYKRERPITHDLCRALIVGLGGQLRRVAITHVLKSTYFAEMQIDGPKGLVQFDARPSDSIAIALRLDAPIFAASDLLSVMDDDPPSADDLSSGATQPQELTAEQLKAYLATLRPEDFGKFSP